MRHLRSVVVLGEVPAVPRVAPRAAQVAGSESDEDARQPDARPFPLNRLEDLRNFEAAIGTRHVLAFSWYERPWLIASATGVRSIRSAPPRSSRAFTNLPRVPC